MSSISKKSVRKNLHRSIDSSSQPYIQTIKSKIKLNEDLIDSKILNPKEEAKLLAKLEKQKIYQDQIEKRKKLEQKNKKSFEEAENKKKDNLKALDEARIRKLEQNIKKQDESKILDLFREKAENNYDRLSSPSKSPSRSSWMSTKKTKNEDLRDWAIQMLGEPEIQPRSPIRKPYTIQAEITTSLVDSGGSLAKKRKKKGKKKKIQHPLYNQVIDETIEFDQNKDDSIAPMLDNMKKLDDVAKDSKDSFVSDSDFGKSTDS